MSGYFDGKRNVLIVAPGFMHRGAPACSAGQLRPPAECNKQKRVVKIAALGPKQVQPDYQQVKLCGYRAVQRVFSQVPPQDVIQALTEVSSLPTSARAVAASQVLIAKQTPAHVPVISPVSKPVSPLHRTMTDTPKMLRTVTVAAASSQSLARTVTAPPPLTVRTHTRLGTLTNVKPTAKPEQIEGLTQFLRERSLEHRQGDVEKWCQEVGAAFLEEVKENLADIAITLSLAEEEKKRLEGDPPHLALDRTSSSDNGLLRADSTVTAFISNLPPEYEQADRVVKSVVGPFNHRQQVRAAVKDDSWHTRSRLHRRPHVRMDGDMQLQIKTRIPSPQEVQGVADMLKAVNTADAMNRGVLPRTLQVKGDVEKLVGRYNLVVGTSENERPIWCKSGCPGLRIYSDADGKWVLGNAKSVSQEVLARSVHSHNGMLPHEVVQEWARGDIVACDETKVITITVIEADLCENCKGTGCLYSRTPCTACLGTGKVQPMSPAPFQKEAPKSFQDLQRGFLQTYGKRIKAELPGVTLVPTRVGSHVEQGFLRSMQQEDVQLQPAYHGTLRKNFDSIQANGLLVPGTGGVTVANGNAHGAGIYTAKLGASHLSKAFSKDSKDIFVCAVADDRSQCEKGHQLGSLTLHSESKDVRHVGNAMVVSDSKRVAPLFIAQSTPDIASQDLLESHKPSDKPKTLLADGSHKAGKQQILIGDQKIWELPEANNSHDAKLLRRRMEAKTRDVTRRSARDHKLSEHS